MRCNRLSISIFTIMSVAIGSVFALTGCTQQAEEDPLVIVVSKDESYTYSMSPVVYDDVVLSSRVNCTYKQVRQQDVSFPVGGQLVDRVYVSAGDEVHKGDLLVELEVESLEEEISELTYRIARNELQLAYLNVDEKNDTDQINGNYKYYTTKTESSFLSMTENLENTKQDYQYRREDLQDQLEFDKKKLAQLQTQLSGSRVYAQMDGVISKVSEKLEGSTSQKDEVILTLADNSECLFEVDDLSYKDCFKEGEPVPMSIAYGTGSGDYELVPYHMSEWGETMQFEIFSGPENAVIEVGTSGTMNITVDHKENVLCVPSGTINHADGKAYVYVLNSDNMREVRWVEVGLIGDKNAEIISGLSEGEKVVRR